MYFVKDLFNKEHLDIFIKYCIIISVILIGTGFLIWNIYLYSLGFIEDNIIRARFILTGISFFLHSLLIIIIISLCSVIFLFILKKSLWLLKKLFDSLCRLIVYLLNKYANKYKFFPNQYEPIVFRIKINWKFLYVIFPIIFLIWLVYYSIIIFPHIPLILGGGQPRSLGFLVTDKNGLAMLQSLEIKIPTGSTYQTSNLCIVYENENRIILSQSLKRENGENVRILEIDKNILDGLVNVPGYKVIIEQRCLTDVAGLSKSGFKSASLLYQVQILNPLLNFFGWEVGLNVADTHK